MLGCIQPMSSPMMNRMLGLASAGAAAVIFSCASAGVVIPTETKPRERAAAKTSVAQAKWSFSLTLLFSVEGIWIGFMGPSCHVRGSPAVGILSLRTIAINLFADESAAT